MCVSMPVQGANNEIFCFFPRYFNETGFNSFRGDFKVLSLKKMYVFFYINPYSPCMHLLAYWYLQIYILIVKYYYSYLYSVYFSDITIKVGSSLKVSRISFRRVRFLLRLLMLQRNIESPVCPICCKYFPVFLTS